MTLTTESEARLAQLAAIAHAQASRLVRLSRGGTIEVHIRVESSPHPRISRDSTVTVREYPLSESESATGESLTPCPCAGDTRPR